MRFHLPNFARLCTTGVDCALLSEVTPFPATNLQYELYISACKSKWDPSCRHTFKHSRVSGKSQEWPKCLRPTGQPDRFFRARRLSWPAGLVPSGTVDCNMLYTALCRGRSEAWFHSGLRISKALGARELRIQGSVPCASGGRNW